MFERTPTSAARNAGLLLGAARETCHAGDFLKTSENLQRILATDNEYTARARAWDTADLGRTDAGVHRTCRHLGSRCAREPRQPDPIPQTSLRAAQPGQPSAIQFTEDVHKVVGADKDPNILLAFAYPAGTVAQPAG